MMESIVMEQRELRGWRTWRSAPRKSCVSAAATAGSTLPCSRARCTPCEDAVGDGSPPPPPSSACAAASGAASGAGGASGGALTTSAPAAATSPAVTPLAICASVGCGATSAARTAAGARSSMFQSSSTATGTMGCV